MGFWKFWEPTKEERLRHEKVASAIKDLQEMENCTMEDKIKNICEVCGHKLITREAEGFDPKTGAKLQKKVCPSDMCFHEGWPGHQDTYEPTFWQFWTEKDGGCRRCGIEFFAP